MGAEPPDRRRDVTRFVSPKRNYRVSRRESFGNASTGKTRVCDKGDLNHHPKVPKGGKGKTTILSDLTRRVSNSKREKKTIPAIA